MTPNARKTQDSRRRRHRRFCRRAASWLLMLLLVSFGTVASFEILLPASLQTTETHEHPDEETSVYCEAWTPGIIHHCIHSTTTLGLFHRGDSIGGNGLAEIPSVLKVSTLLPRTPSLYFLRAPPALTEATLFPA